MMPPFIPASQLRARTANNRDERAALEGRVIEKPTTLDELIWKIEDWRVTWNGLNLHGSDEFMYRGFRVVPGPLPQRFPSHPTHAAGRSAEIRARYRLAADVLYSAIAFDIGVSNTLFPTAPLSGLALIHFARHQTEEIKATANLLCREFTEDFWTRLDRHAKSVSFSAAHVCEWIEAQTEQIIATYGNWPHWAQMPAQSENLATQNLAVAPLAVAA